MKINELIILEKPVNEGLTTGLIGTLSFLSSFFDPQLADQLARARAGILDLRGRNKQPFLQLDNGTVLYKNNTTKTWHTEDNEMVIDDPADVSALDALHKKQMRGGQPTGAQPTQPLPTPAPAAPSAATTPSKTRANPVIINVKTRSGAVVVKRADGKWYDPSNREITDPKLIQAYERSPQAAAQRQTGAMAPGRTAAKTAALAPTKRSGQSFVAHSKPPQRKKGRRR